MTNMTYIELLEKMKSATCWDWHRQSETIYIFTDNIPDNRREIISVRLKYGRGEVKTLTGFDPIKNRWSEYCQPQFDLKFPNKRGLKALLSYIRTEAERITGYPNPAVLNWNGVTRKLTPLIA